jgi:hypothetical protein
MHVALFQSDAESFRRIIDEQIAEPWRTEHVQSDEALNHWVRTNANQLNVVPVDFVESSVVLARVEELNLQRV